MAGFVKVQTPASRPRLPPFTPSERLPSHRTPSTACAAEESAFRRRRSSFLRFLLGGSLCGGVASPQLSQAALVLLPTTELRNSYFLVRAGELESERDGYVDTNPVNKTSMSNGLSDLGKQQILQSTFPALRQLGLEQSAPWFWPSIHQGAYQSAELLAYLFKVGRDRIVPEYSFLDSRGLGVFDGLPPAEAAERIRQVDAGSFLDRPPPTDTGTPNESAEDVFVRVRQLLSITETQYFGDSVVFVSPDSDNLSILQAAVMGVGLGEHASLGFAPGEARAMLLAKDQVARTSALVPCERPPNCR